MSYADAMSETPVKVPDSLYEELKALYSNEQLIELTATIAWENYRARFNRALEIPAQGFSEGAACVLPAAGGSSE